MSAPPNRQYIRRAPSSTNGKHHRDRNCSECVVWERESEGVRATHTHTRHTNSHEMSTYFANHCSTAYAANENVFGSVIYTREEEEKNRKRWKCASRTERSGDFVTHTRLIIFDVSHLLDDAPLNPTVSTPNRFKRYDCCCRNARAFRVHTTPTWQWQWQWQCFLVFVVRAFSLFKCRRVAHIPFSRSLHTLIFRKRRLFIIVSHF